MAGIERESEVLDLGRGPRIPRWIYLAGTLLAAVVVAGSVIVALHDGTPHPAASGSPTTTAAGPAPAQTPTPAVNADDAVIVGNQLFRLSPDGLYRYKLDDGGTLQGDGALPISGLDALAPADSYELAADPASDLIWVVGIGTSPSSALAVDTRTMSVLLRTQWPAAVQSAAAQGAHLYLVTRNAVVDVPIGGGPPAHVAGLDSQYTSITADQARHRLLLFDTVSLRAVSYTPATRAIRSGPKLPFGKGDVLVDGDGRVWAGGYRYTTGGGAVLVRLDPRTLRPTLTSPLAPELGPGAQLVAAGAHVLWVRSGAGGDGLWCVDGASGRVQQRWNLPGTVTSSAGLAYVTDNPAVSATGMRPLRLHGCRG